MAVEFYAKLGIFSTLLTPGQVTSILGLECDESKLKGTKIVRPHAILEIKKNAWIIYSRIPKDSPMEKHVMDVLERVSLVIDKIKSISDQPDTEVELGCVFHSKKEPPLFFTKDMISILSQMGAHIDVDMYFWERKPKVTS
jgi:hypothetical protein